MIGLLLALAAAPSASTDSGTIGGIGQQALPAAGCAAYLFSTGPVRTLVAMAQADPGLLRLSLDGATADYARSTQQGAAILGFAATSEYRARDVTATLDMTIAMRNDITAGAVVSAATLRVDRAGKDSIVVPVAGLIGCAT